MIFYDCFHNIFQTTNDDKKKKRVNESLSLPALVQKCPQKLALRIYFRRLHNGSTSKKKKTRTLTHPHRYSDISHIFDHKEVLKEY